LFIIFPPPIIPNKLKRSGGMEKNKIRPAQSAAAPYEKETVSTLTDN
jgi:hypothetical protein